MAARLKLLSHFDITSSTLDFCSMLTTSVDEILSSLGCEPHHILLHRIQVDCRLRRVLRGHTPGILTRLQCPSKQLQQQKHSRSPPHHCPHRSTSTLGVTWYSYLPTYYFPHHPPINDPTWSHKWSHKCRSTTTRLSSIFLSWIRECAWPPQADSQHVCTHKPLSKGCMWPRWSRSKRRGREGGAAAATAAAEEAEEEEDQQSPSVPLTPVGKLTRIILKNAKRSKSSMYSTLPASLASCTPTSSILPTPDATRSLPGLLKQKNGYACSYNPLFCKG